MVTKATFRKLALSLPEATEAPHHEITSFRVSKKIFATLNSKENRATILLSPRDQDLFCVFDINVMFPVPNKWGKHGWTHINLKTVPREMCSDALEAAYRQVAPEKLKMLLKNPAAEDEF